MSNDPSASLVAMRRALDNLAGALTSPFLQLGMTPEEKVEADRLLLDVQLARLKVANLELEQIVDRLTALEPELKKGIRELDKALKRLEQLTQVFEVADQFLGIVARIVGFGRL